MPSATPDDSCNSVIDHIFKLVTHRLTIIGGDDIITDRQLLDYAHTLRAQYINIIRLENRQYFLVCSGCESHEVVQAQMEESILCGQCQMKTRQLGLRRASSKRVRRANNTHKSSESGKQRPKREPEGRSPLEGAFDALGLAQGNIDPHGVLVL